MARIILAVVAGFITWSIFWIGCDAFLSAVSPDWAKASEEFQTAAENKIPYSSSSVVLTALLFISMISSIISGFVAALIARENRKSTLTLGVLLLLFGIFVQATYWNYMPLWYHLPFLLLLIPMTILGGSLKRTTV